MSAPPRCSPFDRPNPAAVRPRVLAAVTALALVAVPTLAAQSAASGRGADPLAAIGGKAPPAGSWTYRSTVTRGGATVELARRTLTVRAVEQGGERAWLVLDDTRARGQVMTDSVVLAAGDLRPVRRTADMGPMRIALTFPGDSVRGTMSVPGGDPASVLVAPGDRRIVVNGAMLEALLPLLPLAAGWSGTVAQLTPTPLGASVVPLTLTVVGEDSVAVPAGTFAAWRMTARAADAEQQLWVSKADRRLLRQEATPPSSDVVYRTELVEIGGATP